MALTNTAKPSGASLANGSRVVSYETWDTITTTWDTETRTWMATGSLFTNTARVSASITNTAKPS